MYNILGRVTIIRNTRTGLRFSEHLCATRGYRDLYRYRARLSGSAASSYAYVRAHLGAHASTQPPSVLIHACSDANGPLNDTKITRRKHSRPRRGPDHKMTVRPLPSHVRSRSRARQPPHGPAKARQRANHAAADHHAAAVTISTIQPNPAAER